MHGAKAFGSVAEVGDGIGGRIARHMDVVFRRALEGAEGATLEESFARLVTGETHPLGNFALIREGAGTGAVREAAGALVASGVASAVFFLGGSAEERADAHLRGAGYEAAGGMPLMAADISRVRSTALPEGYEFVRVGEEGAGGEAEAWEEALGVGYEIPRRVAALFAPAWLGADGAPDAALQFFAVRKGERLVATSMLCLADGLAGIYCVSTVPEERGKGLGAHATAEPLRRAGGLGYGVGVLQSSAMGESVYRGLGFGSFGGIPMYVRMG